MEKTVIKCSCGFFLRIPTIGHIRFKCPKCATMHEAINGRLTDKKTVPNIGRSRKLVKRLFILSIVIGIIVLSMYRWNDYSDYKEVHNVKTCLTYLDEHPYGLFRGKVKEIKNGLWDQLIGKYDSISTGSERKDSSVNFFKTVLLTMRDNDISKMFLKFDSTLNLKDFVDFSDTIQNLTAYCYKIIGRNNYQHIFSYKEPEIKNVISLKDNFTTGKIDSLQNIILSGLKETLLNIFGEDFFTIVEDSKDLENGIVITIKYQITNSVINLGNITFPEVIPYMIDGVFCKNLLGISIDFSNSSVSIPLNGLTYNFGSNYNSDDREYEVSGIDDAYGQLTRSCFNNFVKQFSLEFGMPVIETENDSIWQQQYARVNI